MGYHSEVAEMNSVEDLEIQLEKQREQIEELLDALEAIEDVLEDGHWQHTKEVIRSLLKKMGRE